MTVYNEELKPQSRVEELLMVDDTIQNVEDVSDKYESSVVISITTRTTEWRLKSNGLDGSLTGEPPEMIDIETKESYKTHGQYIPNEVLTVYRRIVDIKRNNK